MVLVLAESFMVGAGDLWTGQLVHAKTLWQNLRNFKGNDDIYT